jgi:hypothetical protein
MPIWKPLNKRRRVAIALVCAGLIAVPTAAYAFEALTVEVPAMPAVGEGVANACDPNGVTTTYTYGNTSSNGIRVNTVQVSGIDALCTHLTVAFLNGSTVAASYSGTVSAGSATLNTTVWTNDFTSVRVALFP